MKATIQIKTDENTTEEIASTKCLAHTTTKAATSAFYIYEKHSAKTDINQWVSILDSQIASTNNGDLSQMEGILVSQANTLDSLFNSLLSSGINGLPGSDSKINIGERYMRLALKAQSQCQATLRTLGELKNPKSVTIARQANIAQGHQQVNNGQVDKPETSHAETKKQQNELLEDQHGERLDFGAQRAPETSDTAMEAVGAVNGA